MGSRSRRYAALIAALAGACTSAPSPTKTLSSGESWAFPLVGPEEDGLLIAAVYVNGHGPLPFVIDLDARRSVIDESLANALHAEAGIPKTEDDALGLPHVVQATVIVPGPAAVDALGRSQPTRQIDLREVRVGGLVVKDRTVRVVRDGAFDSDGRRIWGKLGRDVLAGSFGFDREWGIGMAAGKLPDGESTPVVNVSRYDREEVPLSRHLVAASVDGVTVRLAVDFGSTTSALRSALWPAAKLHAVPIPTRQVDELGDQRTHATAAIAAHVDAGTIHAANVLLGDYDDRRWDPKDLDGSLGLDAFRAYKVWADWDRHQIVVSPRRDRQATLIERVGRWGDGRLASCQHPGCVTLALVPAMASADPFATHPEGTGSGSSPAPAPPSADPAAPPSADSTAPAPPARLHVARDPARDAGAVDLDITFEAVATDGTRQRYAVTLMAGAMAFDGELDATSVEVLDVGPLPRACPNRIACIHPLPRAR